MKKIRPMDKGKMEEILEDDEYDPCVKHLSQSDKRNCGMELLWSACLLSPFAVS